jgi:hypothetical protein
LEHFFRSGQVAELILVLLVLEFALLAWWHARTGRGPHPRALAPFLLAGAAFALALRAALTGAPWAWVAAPLGAAFLAHLWDLRQRWISSRPPGADRQ